MLYVGIDISKHDLAVAGIKETIFIRRLQIENNGESFKRTYRQLVGEL